MPNILRRHKLPLLDVDRAAGLPCLDQQVGLPAKKCRNLQNVDRLRRRENCFLQLYRDSTVDITHESLIWKWSRLKGWVAEEAKAADLYIELAKNAEGKATWGEPKLSPVSTVPFGETERL